MDCKKALHEAGGDPRRPSSCSASRARRRWRSGSAARPRPAGSPSTPTADPGVGAMVELRCESAPVATNERVRRNWPTTWRSNWPTGPGPPRPKQLLAQPSPSKPGQTLRQQYDDLNNRIREVFKVGADRADRRPLRRLRPSQRRPCGVLAAGRGQARPGAGQGHLHAHRRHASDGRLATRTSTRPSVAKEREILSEAARKEGKPENIIAKMVEGRLRNFYAEQCLPSSRS